MGPETSTGESEKALSGFEEVLVKVTAGDGASEQSIEKNLKGEAKAFASKIENAKQLVDENNQEMTKLKENIIIQKDDIAKVNNISEKYINTIPEETSDQKDLKSILNKSVNSKNSKETFVKSASNEMVKIKSILGPKILKSQDEEMNLKEIGQDENLVSKKESLGEKALEAKNSLDKKAALFNQNTRPTQNKSILGAYGEPKRHSFFIKPENNVKSSEMELKNILADTPSKAMNEETTPEFKIQAGEHSLNVEEAKNFLNSKEVQNNELRKITSPSKAIGVNLNTLGSTNPEVIMDKIAEHISLQKLNGMDSLEINVKHESLGQFKIMVSSERNSDNIGIQIVSNKGETMEFFKEHESSMMKSLQSAGVKVGDFKLVSTMGLSSSQTGDSLEQKFSESNQFNNTGSGKDGKQNASGNSGDSQKRKELWNYYKEQMSA